MIFNNCYLSIVCLASTADSLSIDQKTFFRFLNFSSSIIRSPSNPSVIFNPSRCLDVGPFKVKILWERMRIYGAARHLYGRLSTYCRSSRLTSHSESGLPTYFWPRMLFSISQDAFWGSRMLKFSYFQGGI